MFIVVWTSITEYGQMTKEVEGIFSVGIANNIFADSNKTVTTSYASCKAPSSTTELSQFYGNLWMSVH